MAKAASAEIGQRRYYHHIPAGAASCECNGSINPKCKYALLSVTTILKALPTPWLGAWAAKMVAQTALDEIDRLREMEAREGTEATLRYLKAAPWRTRDAAAERGTAVHAAAELGTTGEDVPENARKRVLAWHRWLDDYKPDIEYQEGTVYYPFYGYAGTFDLLARIGGVCKCHAEGLWLIDIKTGFLSWEHRLQQAAYKNASFIGDEYGNPVADVPVIDHVGILGLHDDGYEFIEIKVGDDEWDAFQAVANVGRYIDRLSVEKPRLVGKS